MSQFFTIVSIISLLIAIGLSGSMNITDRALFNRSMESVENRKGMAKPTWIFLLISVVSFALRYYV